MNNLSFNILHFNDVYNVEPGQTEPVGGAARIATAFAKIRAERPNTITLFSGDAFSPSLISSVTEGKHIPPILNYMEIDCAVYGNHDFDFGLTNLISNAEDTSFPWLMSNCVDLKTNQPLGEGKNFYIMSVCEGRLKLGLIGLIEAEWVDTLSTIDPEEVDVRDFSEAGEELARELKNVHGCDLVIALTHMRWPNDFHLAENTTSIDLILGGHDHNFDAVLRNDKWVIKSGTDFKEFGLLEVTKTPKGVEVVTHRQEVTSDIAEHEEIKALVDEAMVELVAQMDVVIGHIGLPLEGRFTHVRTQETNLGNLIADVMLSATEADLAVLNSGTLRADRIIPVGPFRNRDLKNVLPSLDPLLLLDVSMETLLAVLENGVSMYPKLEGRFPQVSGVKFSFDASKPPGQRVLPDSVKVQGLDLSPHRSYRLCVKSYMAKGRDGYVMLMNQRVLLDEEDAPCLVNSLQNFFSTLRKPTERRRQSVVNMARRRSSTVSMPTITEGQESSDTGGHMGKGVANRNFLTVELEDRIVILNKE